MTLEILTSDALGAMQHGFFTRRGGTSSGIFKGLNCGAGSSDQSEAVIINRGRVADAMQVPHDHLMGVHQIHSADVVTVGSATQDRPKADALVTATKGIALSVLSADCQPVLFADTQAGVIGAAHAGWKGALDGVLPQTVEAMIVPQLVPVSANALMRSDRISWIISWTKTQITPASLPKATAISYNLICPPLG
jgi:copper oxidase (laccase) domain-containing protein